jgi:hypothetical protein
VNGSNLTIVINGKSESAHYSRVTMDHGDLEIRNRRCVLELRSFHSIVGSECRLSEGSTGVVHSVVEGDILGSNHTILFKPCSLMFFPIWTSVLKRSVQLCQRDLCTSIIIAAIHLTLSWFDLSLDHSPTMPVSSNVDAVMLDILSKIGDVFGFDTRFLHLFLSLSICGSLRNFIFRLGCPSVVIACPASIRSRYKGSKVVTNF